MGGCDKVLGCVALALLLTVPLVPAQAVEGPGSTTAYVPRPPIVVQGDDGFTPANGVVAGSGTPGDPYVIAGWELRNGANPGGVLGGPACSIVLQGTSAHVVVEGNRVTHASVWRAPTPYSFGTAHRHGVCVAGSENVTVRGNLVHWVLNDGIVVQGSSHVDVVGNHLERSWRYGNSQGIRVEGGSDVAVRNNTVTRFGDAIELWGGGTVVTGNVLEWNADWSVAIHSANRPTPVEENTFVQEGVRVTYSEGVVLRGNLFDNAGEALRVEGTSHVVARNNTLLEEADVLARDYNSVDDLEVVADVRWNWWGSSSGPTTSTFEEVGGNASVLVDPWLEEPPQRPVGGEGPPEPMPCFPAAACHPNAWPGYARS